MHLVRRAALRAATAAAKPRTITSTSTPFVLRVQKSNIFAPTVMRRFASDEAGGVESAVQSAIDSAEESGSSYKSEETVQTSESASDSSSGSALGAAAGRASRAPERNGSNFILAPTNGVYIGNLLFDITADDLTREFAPYGAIQKCTIAQDGRGLSKGFGYIEFENADEAAAAIAAKHQSTLEGRTIVVNYISRTSRDKVVNPPCKTLFVGNLAFELTDADLNKLFRDIRNVIDVRVAIDRRTGQPRGFAHADFVDVESAVQAMEILRGKELYGRVLRLDYSVPVGEKSSDRSDRGGRGGYGGDRGDRGNRGYGGDRGDRGDRGGYRDGGRDDARDSRPRY